LNFTEAKRFTAEQKNVLNGLRTFLGEEAIHHIIAIFSHATKLQISNRDIMRRAWNELVRSFINDIDNRWGISLNSDYHSPDDPIHKARLGEIKAFIGGIRGVYVTEQLEKSRKKHEESLRRKEEEEKKARKEYEEKLKESARRESEEDHKHNMEKLQQEFNKKLQKLEQTRLNKERQDYDELISELKRQNEESERRIRELTGRLPRTTGCFSLDTKVQLASGKFIEMAELQVGDHICSDVKNGKLEFSEVYLISHLGYCEFPLKMIKIEFTNSDGKKGIYSIDRFEDLSCDN
jgi:hypothetical protein